MSNTVQHDYRSIGDIIIERYHDNLSSDFEANKDLVNKVIGYEETLGPASPSPKYEPGIQYSLKKLRNKIAGYVTHEYNKLQKEGRVDFYSVHGSHAGPKASKKSRKFKKANFKQKPKQPSLLERPLLSPQRYQ